MSLDLSIDFEDRQDCKAVQHCSVSSLTNGFIVEIVQSFHESVVKLFVDVAPGLLSAKALG
jgi:hypothetical protein